MAPAIIGSKTDRSLKNSRKPANVERDIHEFGPQGEEAWLRGIVEWHRACNEADGATLERWPLGLSD
jgi:hypothetical protein